MKIIFFIITVFLLGSALFFYALPKKPTATIDGHVFFLEIAKTPQQQEIGLAKYEKIQQNFAMYFLFSRPDYYTFWMKGMHFPIDILFLQKNTIVTIFSNVPATTDYQNYLYKPTYAADSVLEISAGLVNTYHMKIGDKVSISL